MINQRSWLFSKLRLDEALARGRYACDTPDIMGRPSVLNRLSPLFANSLSFIILQAKVDSIPIA
jgi:hypothetical protein